ncbi:MAG TPA: TonB-dependent receptor [Kofleriaceae bacterium]|jgi:TonB family protein|nr:TonB-dependent receptor [Kofleriaceae bacterium]
MRRWVLAIAVIAAFCPAAHADDVRPPAAPPPARRTGVVTKPPAVLQAQAPEYPPAALAAGKEAKVKVRIHIDATGVVTSVDVLEHVGDGFDEAAVAAAMQYVFDPAEIDGAPAPIAVETTINFVIEQREEPEPPLPPPAPATHAGPANHAGASDAAVTLQGTAIERGTRRALAGVIVSISELALDAVTGDDGTFYFHGVPPGSYKVLAVDPRFERLERPITIAKREALEVRLWMKPRGGNPYETVVEGEREVLEVTRRTIQRQQLTSVPGTFGDPIRVLQTLPGLQRAPFGLGLLLVRGSNPDDTGIYVDGHEVPALFHFLGGPSIFNAQMLDSIDLYPGGFPARFGRHHGGAVALELRPSTSDGVHGEAKVDFIDAGGYLRAPITKDLSFAVAGRRSYIDLFLGLFVPQPAMGGQRIVTPVYYDYSARLDYNLHDNGRLSVFAIGSSDELRVLDKDPDAAMSTDLNSAVKFFRVIGTYERPIGGDLKLTLSPAWGRDTISLTGAQADAAGPFTSIGVVNDNLSYRMRIHGRVNSHLTIDTGLDMLSRVTSYQALVPVDDTLINTQGVDIPPSQLYRGAQLIGLGGYADVGIDVTSRLKLIPSLRLDGYLLDGVERDSVDPRLVARYAVSPEWTIKAYVGHFSQPPQPEALDKRFGNPNVGIEHAIHTGLGYEWKPDRLWSIDSEIYYISRSDLAVFTSAIVQNPDGTFSPVNFLSEGVSNSYGFEAQIKREISEHVYGWLSYTFSRAHQRNHPDQDYTPTPFDEPHVLNAVASWKPGGGWELGARYQLASGRPDTPIIGATYDADQGSYVAVRGPARSIRTPLFSQLDVRAEHDWLFETWSMGAYLDIINVTNAQNVEAVQYDYRYRQSSPVTSFPILPTLGVKGTW